MTFADRVRLWLAVTRAERHRRWLRKARVVHCNPNPRCVVRRRWNVPL